MKKLFACLLALTLACTFLACSNNASGSSGTAESWSVVTQKERLVGTWESTDTCEGLPLTMKLVVTADDRPEMTLYINYSSVPNEQVNDVVNKLKGMPYRFNDYDVSHKVLSKTIVYDDVNSFISQSEINSSGTKIRRLHPIDNVSKYNYKIILVRQ